MVFDCAKRADMKMTRVIAAAAWTLALAGCSGVSSNIPDLSLPTFDVLGPPTTATVTIHSNPTGAEARTSSGGVCRTPCALSIPFNQGFTVTYSLDGYLPQTISVRSIPPEKSAFFDRTPPRLEPNPVWAELQPAPSTEPPAKGQKRTPPPAVPVAPQRPPPAL